MSKDPFENNKVLRGAPSKIKLIVGEIDGEVDFNDLNGVYYSILPMYDTDVNYIHTEFYEKERKAAAVYENAYISLKAAHREYKDYYKIASKYVDIVQKAIDLKSLSDVEYQKMIATMIELKEITSIIEEYE